MNETTGVSQDVIIDPCVECGESTAPGSGRWVNRLPFDDGYKCIECLGSVFDCDRCGAPIPFDEDSVLTVAVAHPTNHDLTEDLRLGPCCHFEGFHN